MRKYIHLAKCLKPKLSEQACEAIANEYSRLRSQETIDSDVARTQPVTARTLETLIRLSTAHAKARMSKTVTVIDAQAAIELVQFAYFKKVLEKEKKKRRRNENNESEDEDHDMENDGTVDDAAIQSSNQSSTRRPKRTRLTTQQEDSAQQQQQEQHHEDDSEDDIMPSTEDAGDLTKRKTRRSLPTTSSTDQQQSETPAFITDDRFQIFKFNLQKIFRESHEQSLLLERIKEEMNKNLTEKFTDSEIQAAVARMTDDNQIMLADGTVFLI